MFSVTMKFPSEFSASECSKWIRFFTSGRYERPDGFSLRFGVPRMFTLGLILDILERHVVPADWEKTEIIVEDEEEIESKEEGCDGS